MRARVCSLISDALSGQTIAKPLSSRVSMQSCRRSQVRVPAVLSCISISRGQERNPVIKVGNVGRNHSLSLLSAASL